MEPAAPPTAQAFGWKPALALTAVFACLLGWWFSLHGAQPAWDEAGHILNSFTVHDLFRHPRPFKPSWWHDLLTVNHLYPPFVYCISGALKLILSPGRGADILLMVLFDAALSLSVFATTRKLTGTVGAGLFAIAFVNMVPLVSWLSHSYLLDFPLVAMVSVALWTLVQWSSKPSWRNALLAGAAVTACCTTKHFGVLYLALPAFACLLRTPGTQRPKVFLQTASMVCMLAIPSGTWFLVNKAAMGTIASDNVQQMGAQAFLQGATANLAQYCHHLPNMLSPLLLFAFITSLFFIKPGQHKALLPAAALAVGGFLAISSVTVTPALDRYAAPAMVAAAIYLAAGFWNACCSTRVAVLVSAVALVSLSFWQFVSFNFTPNPIQSPAALVSLSRSLGVCLLEYRGELIEKACPAPKSDWGHEWAMRTIESVDPQVPLWVHITPNAAIHNVHTFELVAHDLGVKAKPTTSRIWSLNGDTVKFSPETALYYQWFLLTTSPHQGNVFADAQSERDFNALQEFVRTGGKFRLVGERRLPDNTTMQLYRQK